MDSDWISFGFKIVATILFVVLASVIAERSGPLWGGLVASVPVVAGPSYLFLALQQPAPFVAESALSSFSGLSAIAVFLFVLIHMAPRSNLAATFVAAVAAWFAVAYLLLKHPLTTGEAVVLNVVVFALTWTFSRGALRARHVLTALPRRWYDLPLRALLVGCLVGAVVAGSKSIGEVATGLAIMFPISVGGLYVLAHARLGGRAAGTAMASSLRGAGGLGAALFVIHLTAIRWGVTLALLAALVVSVAYWGGLIAWTARRLARAAGDAPHG